MYIAHIPEYNIGGSIRIHAYMCMSSTVFVLLSPYSYCGSDPVLHKLTDYIAFQNKIYYERITINTGVKEEHYCCIGNYCHKGLPVDVTYAETKGATYLQCAVVTIDGS